MVYVPKGCDQQGRYVEAAEAATEIGADEEQSVVNYITYLVWVVTLIVVCIGVALWIV